MGSMVNQSSMGADGARVWIASSGLALVVFLVAHLAGVALAPVAPQQFEIYAAALHGSVWLPLAELLLCGAAGMHAILSLQRWISNRQTGNTAVLTSRRADPLAAFAARSQGPAGLLLISFLVLHLTQLRWPRAMAGAELAAVQEVLHQPLSLALYLLGAMAMGLHLFHGGEAAHRSLGWLNPTNAGRIRRFSRGLALLLGGGFALLALGISWLPRLQATP
jgi:succinate dehydrogenase / fumarate reductase cytochrome b subunit